MFSFISLWFRRVLRPRLTSVGVQLYLNGKIQDLSTYPDQKLSSLVEAIDTLWKPDRPSSYWFETEVHREGRPFMKKKLAMYVTCYMEKSDSTEKTKCDMPTGVRKRMFDKIFRIQPILYGKVWNGTVEVKFTNLKS